MLLRSNISQSIHSCNENLFLYTLVQEGDRVFVCTALYRGRCGGRPAQGTAKETSAASVLSESDRREGRG